MKTALELLREFYIQRIIVYGVIAFFSLFVIVPLGDLRIRFTDDHCSRCPLYSDVLYNITNPRVHYFKIRFGEQAVCEYIISVTAVFCLLYSLLAGGLYFFLYRKDNAETREENNCKDAQNFANWRGFDGSNFYISLSIATAGSWLLFVSWLFQGALGVWKLWRLNLLPFMSFPCCKQ